MKKILFLCVLLFTLCIGNFAYASTCMSADSYESESLVIDYILGEEGLNILPDNKVGETLTKDEMVDILISYTGIFDDDNFALMMNLRQNPFMQYQYESHMISKNPFGFEDYRSDDEKYRDFMRLFRAGIVNESNDGLFYPDALCTWGEAKRWLTEIIDRVNLHYLYQGGYDEYLSKYALSFCSLDDDEVNIYSETKRLMFYMLFSVPLQKDTRALYQNEYYENTSDILYLLHNKYYKIGQCLFVNGGIEIDGTFYSGNCKLINDNCNVLCIYDKGQDNSVVSCISIDDDVFQRIKAIKTASTIECFSESTINDLFYEPDKEYYLNIESDFKADYVELLGDLKIPLWTENAGNTISVSQVIKTANEMLCGEISERDLHSQLNSPGAQQSDSEYGFIQDLQSRDTNVVFNNELICSFKPCSYGECIRILSFITGWEKYAEDLILQNGNIPYPGYYRTKLLEELNVFDFSLPYNEENIKDEFPELVWKFMNIPVLQKDEDNSGSWYKTPSLRNSRRT